MSKKTKKTISFEQFDPTKNELKTIRTSLRIPKIIKGELNKVLRARNASAKKNRKRQMSMNSFMVHTLIGTINSHNSR